MKITHQQLEAMRTALGYSRKRFSEITGINYSWLMMLENGVNLKKRPGRFKLIAKALGVPPEEIFTYDELNLKPNFCRICKCVLNGEIKTCVPCNRNINNLKIKNKYYEDKKNKPVMINSEIVPDYKEERVIIKPLDEPKKLIKHKFYMGVKG